MLMLIRTNRGATLLAGVVAGGRTTGLRVAPLLVGRRTALQTKHPITRQSVNSFFFN
jgi:hypothetical protein